MSLFKRNKKEIKDEAKKLEKEVKKKSKQEKLNKKYGIDLTNAIKCVLEDYRHGTFSNNDQRNIVNAYIVVNNDRLIMCKESVWIKSNMGKETIYYSNIASINLDSRGLLNASTQLVITFKGNKEIVLKYLNGKDIDKILDSYNNYMDSKNNDVTVNSSVSASDEIRKAYSLFEKGIITEDEFNKIKSNLI